MEDYIDRILDGSQKIVGRPFDDKREEFCKIHLKNRTLSTKKFVICDLLRIAHDYTDDPKLKKLLLRITSQASAMQVALDKRID